MIESTAILPQEETRADRAPESAPSVAIVESPRRWSPVALVIWLLIAVGIVLFVAFARLPIEAGWRNGRSMRVLDVWRLFSLELTQAVGPLVTPALATALVLVILGGALLGLWLALSVTNDDTAGRPD